MKSKIIVDSSANLYQMDGVEFQSVPMKIITSEAEYTDTPELDVVDMANVAQLCNNLHSLYLAGGEHFVETPNYHVFDLFKGHQGGRQLCLHMDVPELAREDFRPMPRISASASEKDGVLTLTLGNLDMTASQEVRLAGLYGSIAGSAQVSVLSADKPTACNTFEEPFAVVPHTSDLQLEEGAVLTLPAASVTLVRVQLARG